MEVSVIVPTYNRADLIDQTLRAILQQSHAPAEVIVVDDGSTDATEQVVREFGSAVRYIRIENSGECRARNVGVTASSAPWVAFCDSDDLWREDKLSLQVELCESAPDVEYCFTNFKTVTDNEWSEAAKFDFSPPYYWDLPRRQLGPDLFVVEKPMFEQLLVHQPIFPSTLMMRRSFFERVGRWDEALGRTRSVDLEFHLRCVDKGPIGVVSAPVTGIRKHGGNFSGNPLCTTIGEVAILRHVLKYNPAAKQYAHLIEEQIVRRSAMAAEGAFAAGDFALMRQLLEAVPRQQRSTFLRVKNLIAQFPRPLDRALRSAVTNVSRVASVGRRPSWQAGKNYAN